MAARRQNTESSSTDSRMNDSRSRLSPTPCEMGTMVFARTSASDPFEVAKIIKVDSFKECCYALFENGKKHWVSFTDIQKKDLSLVLNVCCLCQGKARSQFKPLLKCIVCHLGFHRKCHNPIVRCIDPEDATRWQCQICICSSSSSSSSSLSGHNDIISSKASNANQSKQLQKTSGSSSDLKDEVARKELIEKYMVMALESTKPTWFEMNSISKADFLRPLREKKILTTSPNIDVDRLGLPPSRLETEELMRRTFVPVTGCDDLDETPQRKRKQRKFDAESNLREQKKSKLDLSEPTSSSAEDGTQSAPVVLPSTSKPTRVLKGGMLDEMIPAPSSYNGLNHPFKTEIEKEDETKTIECQRKALNLAVQKAAARFVASTNLPSADTKNDNNGRMSAGELLNFNGLDVTNRPKRRQSAVKKTVSGSSFLEEDDLDDIVIRCIGSENMTGRVIGKRTIDGSRRQLLVEWSDEECT